MDSKPIYIYPISPEELTNNFLNGVDKRLNIFYSKYQPAKKEDDELLSVEETLQFLKCSKQALWNWRRNGVLPSYRLGNRVYYKKSDIYAKLVKQE
ncbi:helix-turn-helix domain-containing protein [Confluentibacter citreus]|uniref:helix-turn-helix domain-containing protein n=1 Tax=Confluentibacter citreus TaxID=2007307 RepID=UPI000C283AE4|nr:helix-turn-helix domain-containing protein [Confluentibacter citreus]